MTEVMTRRNTLEAALQYVTHDRNLDNGDPEDNFKRIAELWTYWLREKYGAKFSVSPTDVAMMSLMIKIARLLETETKHDNWIDIAGYAACGAETASVEKRAMAQRELPLANGLAQYIAFDGQTSGKYVDSPNNATGEGTVERILGGGAA